MEIRAFLRSLVDATVSGAPQSFVVLTVVTSTVFVSSIMLFLWWSALMLIDQNLGLLLKVQLIGVASLAFAYMVSDAEEWRKVLPHKRFAFLAFACGVSPACFIPLMKLVPEIAYIVVPIAWSGVVFFYTRFYFTYKAFCNVSD